MPSGPKPSGAGVLSANYNLFCGYNFCCEYYCESPLFFPLLCLFLLSSDILKQIPDRIQEELILIMTGRKGETDRDPINGRTGNRDFRQPSRT